MSSPETFLAFGAIMLIVALIGVAIDWFGKPLRHRKFIPKAYKFPDERLFRSDVFNSSPSPQVTKPSHQKETRNGENLINTTDDNEPKNEDSVRAGSVLTGQETDETHIYQTSGGSQSPYPKSILSSEEIKIAGDESTGSKSLGIGIRLQGWAPGDDIYNLTKNGTEPSPSTVRSRFWKNVGVSPGASIFGTENVERLREGKPPQRRNPRTAKYETMRVILLSYEEGEGRTPIPNWPNNSVDPFGDRN